MAPIYYIQGLYSDLKGRNGIKEKKKQIKTKQKTSLRSKEELEQPNNGNGFMADRQVGTKTPQEEEKP